MSKIWFSDIKNHLGKEIWLEGWLFNKRGSKNVQFLELRDGTMVLQGVVTREESGEDTWNVAETLTQESSLAVRGLVKEHKKSFTGCEIQILEIKPYQITQDFPITPKEHGPDFLLKRRHLWLRSRLQRSILQVRDQIIWALRKYFHEQGYICTDSPILTGTIGEEGSTLFATEYFDEGEAFLAQTGQLYLEATAAALGKTFCFGPTFRAEKSKTRRHLTEFWMLEAEIAFADNVENMRIQEEMLQYVIRHVLENCRVQLKTLKRDIPSLEACLKPFAHISYDEAVEVVRKKGSQIIPGKDFGAEDEVLLTEDYDVPVFVENYPRDAKAFYMKVDPENPDRVLCSDLLAPNYGEIIGASQREDDYDTLHQRIQEFGLDPEKFEWYLDLRKYGTYVHSGFGIGLERTVSFITGIRHIRETIPFPRMMTHLEP